MRSAFPTTAGYFRTPAGRCRCLIERFVRYPLLMPKAKETVPDGTHAKPKRFFYDTAQASNRGSMSTLAAIIPPSLVV